MIFKFHEKCVEIRIASEGEDKLGLDDLHESVVVAFVGHVGGIPAGRVRRVAGVAKNEWGMSCNIAMNRVVVAVCLFTMRLATAAKS